MNEIKLHNTMSPEEQRIAIAQACGWTGFNPDNIPDCLQFTARRADGKWGLIPDYLNDLNAMHEAEEVVLSQGLQDSWLDTLVEVVAGKNIHWSDYHCFPQVNRATAPQRCESFLRTINKWVSTSLKQ